MYFLNKITAKWRDLFNKLFFVFVFYFCVFRFLDHTGQYSRFSPSSVLRLQQGSGNNMDARNEQRLALFKESALPDIVSMEAPSSPREDLFNL